MRGVVLSACLLPLLAGCAGAGGDGGNRVPDLVDDSATTDEDVSVLVDVLLNDSDSDSDLITIASVAIPANGAAVVEAAKIRYTPNPDFFGSDSFLYTAADAGGKASTATLTVTVSSVNDPPTAVLDESTMQEDAVLQVDPRVNDVDIDGNLTVLSVSVPSSGIALISTNGGVTYVPGPDFFGDDQIDYTIDDGAGGQATASILISVLPVEDPPVAGDDAHEATEDTLLTVSAPGVLANDSDIDSAALTAVVVGAPANGELTLNADGGFSFLPDTNFNGSDEFSYRTSDGVTLSDPATVTLTVAAVNDSPSATDDQYDLDEDVQLSAAAAQGVLSNDTDVDSALLTAVLINGAANGLVTLSLDGSFTYGPDLDFSGTDQFTYEVSDGLLSSLGTVTLEITNINDAPIAVGDAYSADENTELVISAAAGVLANDTDPDSGLTTALVSSAANGTLSLLADGSFDYVPAVDFFGDDSFQYEALDGVASSGPATVNISVLRDFTMVLAGTALEIVQGGSAGIEVSIGTVDSVLPGPTVTVSVTGLPPGLSASPVMVTAGAPATLSIDSTIATPQSVWATVSIDGALGQKQRSAPLLLRVRGPPGSLDTTFAGGFARVDLAGASGCQAVATQPDGKIVVAGYERTSPSQYFPTVVRLLPEGGLDTSFGNSGKVTTPFGAFGSHRRVFVEPDGKITLAAWAVDAFGSNDGWALVRLNTGGSLDSSFTGGGVSTHNVAGIAGGSGSLNLDDVARRPNGGFVMTGSLGNSEPVGAVSGAFNPNGARDTTYGSNGYRWYWFDANDNTFPSAVAVDTAGTATVVGNARERVTIFHRVGIARLTATGSLDTNFSSDGVERLDLGSTQATGTSITLLTGGRMLIGSQRTVASENTLTIFLLEEDASPVATFGSAGSIVVDGPAMESEIASASIDSLGRIVAAGFIDGSPYRVMIGRYTADGLPDVSFNGVDAYRLFEEPGRSLFASRTIAFDGDGRILVCGQSEAASSETQMFVMRVWP